MLDYHQHADIEHEKQLIEQAEKPLKQLANTKGYFDGYRGDDWFKPATSVFSKLVLMRRLPDAWSTQGRQKVQTIGRGLRPAAGKTDLIILDHGDTTSRLGQVTHIHWTTLDDGETARSVERDPIKREPSVKLCPECHCVLPPGARECPACGEKIFVASEVIERVPGQPAAAKPIVRVRVPLDSNPGWAIPDTLPLGSFGTIVGLMLAT
jgi:hypothetical protein